MAISPAGRLAPLPFSLAVIVVYLLSFGSQALLSPPVNGLLGVVLFALAQAVLIAIWIVLHTRRLRDAGRPTGLALGIAAVYAIEIVLLILLVWLLLVSTAGTTDGAGGESSLLHLFVILALLSSMAGDPSGSALYLWMVGFSIVMGLPIVIGIAFSFWAAALPRAP